MEEALKRIYHDPADPGSLGGVNRLLRRAVEQKIAGVNTKSVQKFLQGEQAYTLHKPAKRHYKRNPTYVSGIDAQWQIDLADMQALARQNDGYRYILTVIDVFSKYAWIALVRSKDASTVTNAFKQILDEAAPRKPKRVQSDKGKEFFNKEFASLMKRHSIEHFASNSDQKAAVVERFNRTIKTRLWTYMSDRGTVRWVDVINDIVKSYNQSTHRSIGMPPSQVRKADEARLWSKLYGDGDTEQKRERLAPGSMVRISKSKGLFEKGYMPNWSKEHFTVDDVGAATSKGHHKRKPLRRPVYKISDYDKEPIQGTWYPEELEQISDNQFRIEKVLKHRIAEDGTKELLVKWEGWPATKNSWIKETDQYNVYA